MPSNTTSSMLIDSHAHLNFNAYKDDADEVIRRSLENNVWMINVGSQYKTSERAVELADGYEKGVYAAVGLHPIHLETGLVKIKNDPAELPSATHGASKEEIEIKAKGEDFNYEKYKELAKSEKVVAIGEIGLDYYWRPKTTKKKEIFKQKQKDLLLRQLELAKELNLPVILHCRVAHQDLIEILKSEIRNPKSEINSKSQIQNSKLRGVIHCFTGTWKQAQEFFKMGFYIGFNGIIFKLDLDEIIKNTPPERILIETDCPYLTPPLPAEALAKAGLMEGRNEPIYVKYVAEKIAKIKKMSYEEVAKITTQNAKKLFKII